MQLLNNAGASTAGTAFNWTGRFQSATAILSGTVGGATALIQVQATSTSPWVNLSGYASTAAGAQNVTFNAPRVRGATSGGSTTTSLTMTLVL